MSQFTGNESHRRGIYTNVLSGFKNCTVIQVTNTSAQVDTLPNKLIRESKAEKY